MAARGWYLLLFSLLSNFLLAWADRRVFQSLPRASTVFQRPKRANAFFVEEMLQGHLERECYEERCSKEEAREYFEDDVKTEAFWTIYYDGDQCKPNPCQNGATCTDKIGGYICNCTELYHGVNCERDISQCFSEGPFACEHFCRNKFGSYHCFCAEGYRLHSDGRTCTPEVQNPCGKALIDPNTSLSEFCSQGHCPWQVTFVDEDGEQVCNGVILGSRSVLTTAACVSTPINLSMVIGKRSLEMTGLKPAAIHKRYVAGRPGDDLALLTLNESIPLGLRAIPLCLPEKDFSENVLMRVGQEGLVRGGETSHSYMSLDDCRDQHNLNFSLTNKMFCMEERWPFGMERRAAHGSSRCNLMPGSPAATVDGRTAFLTGVLLSHDCSQGLVFTKLSRYLAWIRQQLERSERLPERHQR